MPFIPRAEVLSGMRQKIAEKRPVIGAGAGSGLSAKCEEAGGADLIIIYNSGRFRLAGRGSLSGLLAYGNANDLVIEMGREVLPVTVSTPVLAGVNGTDPFLDMGGMLRRLREMGFSGIQNFPTVGLIDGVFRANLEETGMSYRLEVELVRRAHEEDLLTTPYVFSAEDAAAMTEAGADIVVCHMGLTSGGSIGAGTAKTLDDCVELATEWAEAARSVRSDVIVLVHGGPVAEPGDVRYVLDHASGLHGFYGASSMERLPTERAQTAAVREFASLTLT
jgi:predicted TIM-barrel enzyme